MTCGIYMIQNKVNGKIYIGQAVDIEKRWQRHKAELRGNYHVNKHLQNAWNKDGEDNFEFTIICECDESQLNTMEEYYIFELMSYDYRVGYNKNYGGTSGRPTEESRRKQSEAMKGEKNPNYGKQFSEETRKKLSEANKGKTIPKETRNKMSEAQKGKYNHFFGKHHSEETRKKISEANKGKQVGVKNPKSIPVVQLTLNGHLVNVYGSACEAERSGFSHSHINQCIKGKLKTHGGYKWMYLHDYISNIHPNIKTINLFNKSYKVNQ